MNPFFPFPFVIIPLTTSCSRKKPKGICFCKLKRDLKDFPLQTRLKVNSVLDREPKKFQIQILQNYSNDPYCVFFSSFNTIQFWGNFDKSSASRTTTTTTTTTKSFLRSLTHYMLAIKNVYLIRKPNIEHWHDSNKENWFNGKCQNNKFLVEGKYCPIIIYFSRKNTKNLIKSEIDWKVFQRTVHSLWVQISILFIKWSDFKMHCWIIFHSFPSARILRVIDLACNRKL